MVKHVWMVLVFWLAGIPCVAQSDERVEAEATGFYCSGGTMAGGGAYTGVYTTGSFRRITNPGVFVDVGVAGPTLKTKADGVFSFNYQSTYNLGRHAARPGRTPALFFLSGGYSGFFNNGHGVNYGSGVMLRFPWRNSAYRALRLEYREMLVPGWGRQPGFRVAFEMGGND